MEQHARIAEEDHVHAKDSRRPVTALFGDLMQETTSLIHNEAQLIKSEISQKVSQVESGASSLAIGGAVGVVALLVLVEAAVFGLSAATGWAWWLSALIVGGVLATVAMAMLASGRKRLRAQSLAPHTSAASVQKDAQLMREHMR